MKIVLRILFLIVIIVSSQVYGQHHSKMVVEVDDANKSLNIRQTLTFFNQSDDTLKHIVLNDWNHAYSSKNTPLAQRFSDEFVRSFHLAKDHERGSTNNLTVIDGQQLFLNWSRLERQPDLIEVTLRQPLLPGQSVTLDMTYVAKIPSDRFTRYGYKSDGSYNLRNWFLAPARYREHGFSKHSNNNIDDIANGVSNYDLEIKVPKGRVLVTDLDEVSVTPLEAFSNYVLHGGNRTDFSLYIQPESTFYSFRNKHIDVRNGLGDTRVTDVEKAIIVDRIVNFVEQNIGNYPHSKITVSQSDYDRNPFYGLNQLPSFISPFSNDFVYEVKFLKTYLNNYLKSSLRLDPRKDNWIYDGIQVYIMMKYIDEHWPDAKMMGGLSSMKLLKSYNLVNLGFNDQYSYLYMLMLRKNLDQPLSAPKNSLIKFNEQIAGKYRSGLSFRYLDDYLGGNAVQSAIQDFYALNLQRQTNRADFEAILRSKSSKDINWFFNTIIDSRKIIDYKFVDVQKTADSVKFTLRNKTGTTVPITVYGIKDNKIVFRKWVDDVSRDSTMTWARQDADKIVLNLENEVPEYNLRNNWKSLKGSFSNRPLKFNVMKDLEDPNYNQILYVPTLTYNLYDGFSPGLRFHNKTILEKPFTFDINPVYSSNTKSLIGNFGIAVSPQYRKGRLYNIRYGLSGSYFHYAPDAAYTKINPTIQFRFREPNFRNNRRQLLMFREVIVHRDRTEFLIDGSENFRNYSVFNARYGTTKTELTKHFSLTSDLQIANQFAKLAAETEYRRLFEDNRQFNLRVYAGSFLYNRTESDFFSFALDRPTDYLFDYNYYGRSENSGIFSQQLVLSEGGFKSKLDTPFANQWIATVNAGYSIWNWIEAYADAGFVKNRHHDARFLYDSGIRLNLVTDYLEFYFPIYSSNGWEIGDRNYREKIRFIVAFDPKTLTNLFTRKWL